MYFKKAHYLVLLFYFSSLMPWTSEFSFVLSLSYSRCSVAKPVNHILYSQLLCIRNTGRGPHFWKPKVPPKENIWPFSLISHLEVTMFWVYICPNFAWQEKIFEEVVINETLFIFNFFCIHNTCNLILIVCNRGVTHYTVQFTHRNSYPVQVVILNLVWAFPLTFSGEIQCIKWTRFV